MLSELLHRELQLMREGKPNLPQVSPLDIMLIVSRTKSTSICDEVDPVRRLDADRILGVSAHGELSQLRPTRDPVLMPPPR